MKRNKVDWIEAQSLYDSGLTVKEVCKEIGVSPNIAYDFIRTRSRSEIKLRTDKKYGVRRHTPESRAKLSKILKERHEAGTAYSFAHNKGRTLPSWPEQFWLKVLENNNLTEGLQIEYVFDRYSLDFAWPKRKKCLEIDGEQHYLNEQQIASDKRKDCKLTDAGWQVMRIRWKEMFKNPSPWILKVEEFINS